MTRDEKWDALWRAACGVMAAHETYSEPNRARPMPGIFPALDRLDEQCARLRHSIAEISPDDCTACTHPGEGPCEAECPRGQGYLCTRAKGHSGEHVACGGEHHIATWGAQP